MLQFSVPAKRQHLYTRGIMRETWHTNNPKLNSTTANMVSNLLNFIYPDSTHAASQDSFCGQNGAKCIGTHLKTTCSVVYAKDIC